MLNKLSVFVLFILTSTSCFGQTITYSIEEAGSFKGQTQQESEAAIEQAFDEASAVCGATWTRVKKNGKVRHYWASESEIRALGRHYFGSRKTYLNNTRELGLGPNASQSAIRIPMTVVQHESIGHFLRWPHVDKDDMSSVMNVWARVRYLTPYDVARLQARYGYPEKKFYPPEQKYYGDQIRVYQAKRKLLIVERDSLTGFVERAAVQLKILKTVADETISAMAWLVVKAKWKDVPFAG